MLEKRSLLPAGLFAFLLYLGYFYWNYKAVPTEVSKSELEELKSQYYLSQDQVKIKAKFNKKLIQHMNQEKFIPPFIDFVSPYATAPKYNISVCCVSKCMSTLMRGITCSLYDTEEFMKNNRSVLEEYQNRSCVKKNEYRKMEAVEQVMGAENFTRIAVIRNPIERFISFFSDKCIRGEGWRPADRCYGCKHNVTCFLEQQYSRFLEYSSNPNAPLKPSLEDYHTLPFSWSCEFGKYLKDYKIVKMDPKFRREGVSQLLDIFKESKVPKTTISFIEDSVMGGETVHATYDSPEHLMIRKEIESSEVIRGLLRRIYYLDYLIFGFDTTEIDQ